MADDKPQFENFKEAFCAYYRVPPEKYSRAVLWRSLPVTRRPLAWPILAFNRTFFATDLDIIRNLAPVRTADNFSLQLDELHTINRLERNIRRGFLGIRASGSRLMTMWQNVEPYIRPDGPQDLRPTGKEDRDETEWAAAAARVVPEISRASGAVLRRVSQVRPVEESAPQLPQSRIAGAARSGSFGRAQDNSVDTLRRLELAYQDTVRGTPLLEAVRQAGLADVAQFMELLEVRGTEQPKFKWLGEQLRRTEELEALRLENARLRAALGEPAAGRSSDRATTSP